MTKPEKCIEIFTDGACRGNPGPGGWGAILRYNNHEKLLCGAEQLTTNNRMELTAVIQALSSLKTSSRELAIKVTTDSQYVRKGITEWLQQWQRRNWLTSNKQPVKNIDLWQQLAALAQQYQISWHWVKGHSGHQDNELADQLANQAIDEMNAKQG